MTENPLARSLANDSLIPASPEPSLFSERNVGRSKADIKQPRFGLTPSKLWTAFLFRWKSALTAGLVLATIGAGIAWLTYKPKYTAVASMRMIASKPRILPSADEAATTSREGDFQKIQAQLIKSRDMLTRVVKNDDVRSLQTIQKLESPETWLEKELQATFIPGTDIFRIWLTGENAEDITTVVNTVQSEFKKQFVESAEKDQVYRLETIVSVMVKAEDKVRNKRQQLSELADLLKTGDTKVLGTRQIQALDKYGKLEGELYSLESALRSSDALISVLKEELKESGNEKPSPAVVEEFMLAHPSVQKEQAEVSRIEALIKEYSKISQPGAARLKQYATDLKAAQVQLATVKQEIQPDVLKRVQSASQRQTLINLNQAEVKRNVQEKQFRVVSEKARELGLEVANIGKGSFQIENLRNEIEETESTLKQLRAVKDRLEIENFNKKKTIDGELPAVVPTVNQSSLVRTTSLYSFAGLIFGLLIVSFLEARLFRVHHSTDVAQELGIQTLGVLPLLEKGSAEGYGRDLGSEQSLSGIMFADAVNSLCTRLLCDDRLGRSAVIMVTSANENEGKTLLATQLTMGLAHSGRRTLLLDCDFRKPHCHEQLGLPEAPGLNEVLNGSMALEDALREVPNSDAKFMTSGQTSPQAIKSLSNGSFAALLERLRKDFDCIIIDSPPTMLVSDGLLLGKLADGAIMVVRSKVSKGPAVFSAFEQLSALKIPTLGAVINATPSRAWSRYSIR